MAGSGVPSTLADLDAWASAEEKGFIHMLLGEGQAHLFEGWKVGTDAERKHAFCAQVRALEGGYPGGVKAYLSNARALLKSSAAGDNPFEGMRPEVPHGVSLEYGSGPFVTAEEAGIAAFKDCAFVLVAGGLGERLEYSDIKVSLPVETVTDTCYLQLYIEQILAMQAHSNKLAGLGPLDRQVPLAIMTSDDTHARTVALLAKHANFGMPEGQITIIKQEKVAALVDNDAHMALVEGDPYAIDTKPHGHGDVHTLLGSSGLAAKWHGEGRQYLVFFQDTNSLCFKVTQAAIGVSIQQDFEVNSVTVARKAKDAVGAITKLVRGDGSSITVNVEYNQLEPLLKASGFKEGDVNDPATGFSPFPGNINQLVFKIAPYVKVLERTGGLVPEFVNPKYADATKTKFKKATRLECMMQDHPKVLGPESRVGFTNFPEWTYSPVKNSLTEARGKIAIGAPGRSAVEGELEYYDSACRQLAAIGVSLPAPGTLEVFGFKLPLPPRIVFHPSFAVSFNAFKAKFPTPTAIRVTSRSTLVVSGDVTLEALDLDGTLIIRAAPGAHVRVKRLKVVNAGWGPSALVHAGGSDATAVPDSIRIRGFRMDKQEQRVLEFNTVGEHVVEE